jgi:hypothetical protein
MRSYASMHMQDSRYWSETEFFVFSGLRHRPNPWEAVQRKRATSALQHVHQFLDDAKPIPGDNDRTDALWNAKATATKLALTCRSISYDNRRQTNESDEVRVYKLLLARERQLSKWRFERIAGMIDYMRDTGVPDWADRKLQKISYLAGSRHMVRGYAGRTKTVYISPFCGVDLFPLLEAFEVDEKASVNDILGELNSDLAIPTKVRELHTLKPVASVKGIMPVCKLPAWSSPDDAVRTVPVRGYQIPPRYSRLWVELDSKAVVRTWGDWSLTEEAPLHVSDERVSSEMFSTIPADDYQSEWPKYAPSPHEINADECAWMHEERFEAVMESW